MPSFVLGMDCKLYFDSTPLADAPSTGTWVELANAKDVTINLETGEADITTRANNGWRATAATLKDGSVEFEMLWKPGDTGFDAIKTAWSNAAEIAIAAMDGDITVSGNQGLAGNFTVTNFSRSEPLEDAVSVSVTLKPSSYTTWYEVA